MRSADMFPYLTIVPAIGLSVSALAFVALSVWLYFVLRAESPKPARVAAPKPVHAEATAYASAAGTDYATG